MFFETPIKGGVGWEPLKVAFQSFLKCVYTCWRPYDDLCLDFSKYALVHFFAFHHILYFLLRLVKLVQCVKEDNSIIIKNCVTLDKSFLAQNYVKGGNSILCSKLF